MGSSAAVRVFIAEPAMGATKASGRRRRRGWGAPARRRPPRPLVVGAAKPVRLDLGGRSAHRQDPLCAGKIRSARLALTDATPTQL